MKDILVTLLILMITQISYSQEKTIESMPEEFKVSLEFRPRFELRNGYRQLRNDTTTAAFFTSQRSRLNIQYARPGFLFFTSIQDIRVWGDADPRSAAGTLQIFETYVEPSLTENLSVRIGRQKIMYDNQRLFAQNDWRQNGGSHDALRMIYKQPGLETEFVAAFNQQGENLFHTSFTPSFHTYKALFVHYLKYEISELFSMTLLNAADGFEREKNTHFRYTNGGRLEFEKQQLYVTFAAYLQHGTTPQGQDLRAFYLQPEVKYRVSDAATLRMGAEIFSGDDGRKSSTTCHSFDALYGVNHRFLGTMDYFTRFPEDFNSAGIVNPYLFVLFNFAPTLSLRADGHLFYSENHFVANDETIPKYLGFENDLLISYSPNDYTTVDFGISWMLPEKEMELIKKSGGNGKTPYWSYVMLTFKPDLFQWKGDIH